MRPTTSITAPLLLLLAAAPMAAQGPPPAPGALRTLSVTATGEVAAAPDLAVIHLAVETEAPQAAEAARSNAERAERVLQAVRRVLGEGGKAFTAGYSLYPVYDTDTLRPEMPRAGVQDEDPTIRGYRANNEVRVEVRDLERVGGVIDAAIGAGANRASNLFFALEAREPHVRAALAEAGQAARAEAEAAAAAVGVRLGPVLAVRTGGSGAQPPMPMARMEMAMQDSVTTPVSPGEVTVQVMLEVTYGIE